MVLEVLTELTKLVSEIILSSLCAESPRAVTGRRCPHSGEGEDFLAKNMLPWAHMGLAGSYCALLVGGCGARAVSCKTPIYFMVQLIKGTSDASGLGLL